MPLHADTLAWLEKRNEYRNAIAAALRGEGGDADEEEPDDEGGDDGDGGDGGDDGDGGDGGGPQGDCNVPGRDDPDPDDDDDDDEEPASTGCDLLAALNAVEPIECNRDEGGWPNSDGLYAEMASKIADGVSMRELIPLQRQVNVLESYRKMLLHKKWRICHHIAHWCECMKDEDRSQSELERLMLNEQIGLVVEENTSDDS